MPACASYGSVCAEGSCGRFISTVVFCRLYIAPSRNLATGPNPMVATIMPKIVPEMKLNIISPQQSNNNDIGKQKHPFRE